MLSVFRCTNVRVDTQVHLYIGRSLLSGRVCTCTNMFAVDRCNSRKIRDFWQWHWTLLKYATLGQTLTRASQKAKRTRQDDSSLIGDPGTYYTATHTISSHPFRINVSFMRMPKHLPQLSIQPRTENCAQFLAHILDTFPSAVADRNCM